MAQPTAQTDPVPFGFPRRPFQPTADPDFFYPGAEAGAALDRIVAALRARRGVCVLTGDTGTGKTTVLRTALVELASGGGVFPISGNAPLGLDDLIYLLASSPTSSTASPEAQLEEISRRMRDLADEGRPVVLAIDEAQALGADMLGHVIGLLGRASGPDALGSLLLVGQPALAARLKALDEGGPEVAVRCSLGPLPLAEVGAYIAHRLRQAGADRAEVFSPAAVDRIAHLSGGAPRFVNLLCHESLAIAGRQGASRVEPDVVDGVAEDLGFPGFIPRPRLPGIGAATSRGISRRVVWAATAGVAAAALLVALPWLPRTSRRVPPAPETRPPALAASSDRPSPTPGASPEPVRPDAVESPPQPQGPALGATSDSTSGTPAADATVMGPPAPERRPDASTATPSVPSGQMMRDGRVARTSPDVSAPAPSAPPGRGTGQALLLRAENGDVPSVLALLAAGESPDARDQTGVTPLMLAAIHGNAIMSDALLQRGASVNARTRAGQTALMMAAINNNLGVARRLLDRGAAVDARTAAGWTALMYAAWEGRPEIARLLLERGADVSLRDRDGWTAQRYAAWRVNPPPPESGGAVTGIDHVEPSLRARPGHTAVLDLLTEAARRGRDQGSPVRRKTSAATTGPAAGAPSSSSSAGDGHPLDSSARGHGAKVPHWGEP
jgi:type II secretory pathway predicted ATPase ExeA